MKNKIIIFSDLHIGKDVVNKSNKAGINTYGNLKKEIEYLKEIILLNNPVLTVNLGDVITWENEQTDYLNYKYFYDLFNLENLYNIYGNQDLQNLNICDLEKLTKQPAKKSVVINNVRHVFLDAVRNGPVTLSNESFNWLQKELNNKNEKVIIYTHYPISLKEDNVSYYHKNNFKACFIDLSEKILELLRNSNCIAVISGHTHFYYECNIDGIKHCTIPSFSEEKNGKPSLEYAILDSDTLKIEINNLY